MKRKRLWGAVALLICFACAALLTMAGEPAKGAGGPVLAEDGRYHGLGLLQEPEGVQSRFIKVMPSGAESIPLPESVDNSQWLPPVGDQGNQYSCVAFAFGYYCKTYAEVKEHGWSQFDNTHQFSPAYIYNQAQSWPDNGMYGSDAIALMQELGACSLAQMPFNDQDYTQWPFEAAYKEALHYRIGEGYSVDTTLSSSLDAIKGRLASGQIGVFGLYVYGNFDYIGSFNNTYCLSQVTGTNPGSHMTAVVGYDDAMTTADGVGAFKCVNSWGTSWGAAGFFWLSYPAVTDVNHLITQGVFDYFDDLPNDSPVYAAKIQLSHSRFRALKLAVGTGSPSSPTTSEQLFDFLSYQDDRTPSINAPAWPIWVDLTPIFPVPQGTNTFISAANLDPNNGVTGQIQVYTLYRLSDMNALNYTSVPVSISYSGSIAHADLSWPWATLAVTTTANPASGGVPLTVAFTSSIVNGTAPFTYNWNFGDGGTSTQQNPSHTYTSTGDYSVNLTAQDSTGKMGYAAPLTITAANVPPPVIASMTKKGNPFRILVIGSNLQSGIAVFINGVPWTNLKWSSTAQIQLKGGGSLKALVPKNTPTQFKFVNPDGGFTTYMWHWP